jgi:hypothetical protein
VGTTIRLYASGEVLWYLNGVDDALAEDILGSLP